MGYAPVRLMSCLLAAAGAAGCGEATAPDTHLALTRPPDLVALVASTTHESGISPAGPLDQYAVWIAIPPATTAGAGVVVGASTPVFIRRFGVLSRATAAAIGTGDSIQIWHDISVAYGAAEAPPGSPCYMGTQILILR